MNGSISKWLCVLCTMFALASTNARENPYDEKADAKVDIKAALTRAAAAKNPVIVVFGANWCGDCKMLDHAMHSGASAQLFSSNFQIVKVNVGHFDKNLDVAESYGVPLKKGIPAVVILSSDNKILYATKSGELADARQMGDKGVYDFFTKVTESSIPKK